MFIDRYKQSNLIKNCCNFLKKIKKLKLLIIKFNQDKIIKPKVYYFNYIVRKENSQSVIINIYNKYIFSTNDRVWRAWTKEKDIFLQFKEQKQEIMILEFFFDYLNLAILILKKRQNILKKIGLTYIKVMKIFKYEKNNNSY